MPAQQKPGSRFTVVSLLLFAALAGLVKGGFLSGCKDAAAGVCQDKECGTWEGTNCGRCAGTDYCTPQGRCEDACAGKQCGEWHRVDCGQCPTPWQCSPSEGVCVIPPPPPPPPPPPCPDEFGPAGEICINGYAHWVFDDRGGEGAFMEHRMADPMATDDSTYVVVQVYDFLAYANDPETAQPLGTSEVNPKEGTFRVLDITVPSQGILAVVVDDIHNDASDLFAPTGIPFPAVAYENLTAVIAFGVTHDQVQRWSSQIGQPALAATGCPEPAGGGERTLLTCGTWISRFVNIEGMTIAGVLGAPEGVVPEDPGGEVPAWKTFYPGIDANGQLIFDDPTQCVVWSDDQGPHGWTGRLGSVFGVYVPPGEMGGHCQADTPCAEAGCIWMEILGGSIEGALFVQFMPQVLCADWPPPEDTTCATPL